MKKVLRRIVLVAVLIGLGFCVYKIYEYYNTARESRQSFTEIAEIAGYPDGEPPTPDLTAYNADQIGWIYIADTLVNYPVMQTRDDPEYYLHHDFYHDYSTHGVPFLEANCDIAASENLLIYGHHMRDGTMFAVLEKYKDESFCSEHSIIEFDTLVSEGTYLVIAAFNTQANTGSSSDYAYQSYLELDNQEEFDTFYDDIKARSLYETNVTAQLGDRFITLTTCEYSKKNGRMVVIAKLIV